jgi:hypothetical protein
VRCNGTANDKRRGQEPVLVLMVFTKEEAVKPASLRKFGFRESFLHAAIHIVAARRICD